jgi:peroxiredoxin
VNHLATGAPPAGNRSTASRSFIILAILILALALPCGASQPPSAAASWTRVRDIDGHQLNLFGQDTKAVVLFFVTNNCPITNSYAPEINRIVADYEARKIAFYAVYPDPTLSISAIRKHAHEFGFHIPLIPDAAHHLVHGVGATVTPEAAVLERGGKLVYLGRIDDLYADFGKRRPAPTQRYVRQALDAVLSGKPVAVPSVDPIGCFISDEP